MGHAVTLLAGVLIVIVITAVTGYFVAQEFAYMAVDRSRLAARSKAGDAVAERALRVTGRTSFMLSGAQLGITVTGLLVGYVAEPLIGESIGALLGGIDVPAGIGLAVGLVVAMGVSTVIQMVFGELVPKNLAIARPEPVARALSRSTLIYLRALGWLIRFFDASANRLVRAMGMEPVHDVEHSASPRDLRHIVAESRETGDLPPDLSLLIDRILDFPARDVEHAMIPRAQVGWVEHDDPVARVRARMAAEHSRYPVLDAEDRMVGVVHLEDVLAVEPDGPATAADVMRPPVVVPELMPLPDALRAITDSAQSLACVVDEFGGFSGVLTLEDLAEELVGEITDEHDEPGTDPAPEPQTDGAWVMPGDTHLDEVERLLDHPLPRGDYETIAGLAIATAGALPDVGAVVAVPLEIDPADLGHTDDPPERTVSVEVLDVDNYVPSRVRLRLDERAVAGTDLDPDAAHDPGADADSEGGEHA